MQVIRLAWRNVWRNRRRSLITISAVLFSMLIIVLTRALQYGSYDAMESYSVQLFVGEVQVQRTGFHEEQTLAYSLTESETAWQSALESKTWVRAATRRLSGFGLVSGDEESAGAMILGVDPDAETEVSEFLDEVVLGERLDARESNEAVLGQLLAKNLKVSIGDTVVVLTQGFRNQMGADIYRVRGLVRTGSLEMDRALMAVSLPDAQLLFSMPGRFTEVVIRTDDFRLAPDYAADLSAMLPESEYAVLDWIELMPELRQMIVLDNVSGAIFLLFMLVLVGFEIFNTTNMAVLERTREFGVMQALGMRPFLIARLVLIELCLKLGLALVISMLASGLLLTYLHGHPIPLTESMVEMYEGFGISMESLVFSTRGAVFLEPLVSITIIAVLATVNPVLKVFRLETASALRRAT
jgi:putative ABC transport system permease protein